MAIELEALKAYCELTPDDAAHLNGLLPLIRPEFPRLSQRFQDALLSQRGARETLAAARQIPRLGRTFLVWLEQLLEARWGQEYFKSRCREGRFLARIGLDQHHVLTALDVIRLELAAHVGEAADPVGCRAALDKAFDFDLAIMAGAQREEELLAQAQRARAAMMGQLVATMCHELRGPLSVMESSLFILQRQPGRDARAQKHLDRLAQQIGIVERRITGMLDLIRDRPLHRQRLKLAEIVEPVIAHAAVPEWIRVTLDGLEDVPELLGDRDVLMELAWQLLQNSLQAIGAVTGEVRISGHRGADQDVVLSFMDSGPGVDSWLLPQLFEPFVTSRPGQIGLGLAHARRIAELHRGRVEYQPGPPHRFAVYLPRA